MAGKSSQADARGSDIFGKTVSGKSREFHTARSGAYDPGASPMSASGGTTNDYTESGEPYRSHTFTSSGAFTISSLGTGPIGNKVDVMVVGGGGGGGSNIAGGGGAGGFRSFTNVTVTAGP